jgi:hypothetical protein
MLSLAQPVALDQRLLRQGRARDDVGLGDGGLAIGDAPAPDRPAERGRQRRPQRAASASASLERRPRSRPRGSAAPWRARAPDAAPARRCRSSAAGRALRREVARRKPEAQAVRRLVSIVPSSSGQRLPVLPSSNTY